MKNSFCRICRGRFNLKYTPAAVDSEIKKSIPPRTISALIAESGEVSENICWDCDERVLGFHKIIDEEDEGEELVVVDDDEILYKSLEKSKRNHRLSKETEIIQIDSSDSDAEELVIIPDEDDDIITVEAARTNSRRAEKQSGGVNKNKSAKKNNAASKMNNEKEDTIPRGRVFECKQCPLCPYHSGIEHEVVYHIRQTHPQYHGDNFRFDTKEGDSLLTRRIIFAHLWTFFECKECGKIYDRFWPHRKHITTHDRKKLKNAVTLNNNNKVSSDKNPRKQQVAATVKNLKRPLDEINGSNDDRVKMSKTSNDHHPPTEVHKTLVVKLHKSEPKTIVASNKQRSQSEKSKNNALVRKQQKLQSQRNRRRQKKEEKIATALKAKNKAASKPTFKMPTQPAPRAYSIVKPLVQKLSFTCKLCSKVSPSFLAWNSHMIRYHSDVEFNMQKNSSEPVCRLCDKHFHDASIIEKHIRFSHRRKNRKLDMEVNGNDKDEICCQSQTFKTKEAKDGQQLQPPTESLLAVIASNGPDLTTAIEEPHDSHVSTKSALHSACVSNTKSALFCQYCGSLFEPETIKAHESSHIADEDVKRFFVTKPKV